MADSDSLHWQTRTVGAGTAEALAEGHHLPTLVARVLAARGWQPGPELASFLEAEQAAPPDPLDLVGVREAATRLWEAVDKGERITICGDYDVDGVTGTALLVSYLRAVHGTVDYYLPHRYHDGYGLNEAVLRRLAAAGSRVLVTVDNGISSLEEIALAKTLGMDVIVTDHHLPGEALPDAHTLVNPRLMPDPGRFAPLAGVGVAYMLVAGMGALRPVKAPALDELLDLVAIGTIGDQSPMTGENRRLVRAGLQRIATSPRRGLAALARSAKLSLAEGALAEQVAHRLIPRLNAAGRMANAGLALELLLAGSEPEARDLAEKLHGLNRQRRTLTETVEAQSLAKLAHLPPASHAIVLADPSWHHGVTGIVAARLAERFGRPALLFAPDGEGWRGSGRTAAGVDLHACLTALSDHLGRFGGHAAAVGCTVSADRFDAFAKALDDEIARQQGQLPPPEPGWQVDAEVPLAELTYQSVEGLACLEPTGPTNPQARLAARDLKVVRQGVRGPEGQHLWVELTDGVDRVEAIGFGMGAQHPLASHVDAVFVPVAERWQGKERLQLRLLAIAGH